MSKFKIELIGCDDWTDFEMELNESQEQLVKELCEKSKEVSTYDCMPIMRMSRVADYD